MVLITLVTGAYKPTDITGGGAALQDPKMEVRKRTGPYVWPYELWGYSSNQIWGSLGFVLPKPGFIKANKGKPALIVGQKKNSLVK